MQDVKRKQTAMSHKHTGKLANWKPEKVEMAQFNRLELER